MGKIAGSSERFSHIKLAIAASLQWQRDRDRLERTMADLANARASFYNARASFYNNKVDARLDRLDRRLGEIVEKLRKNIPL